MRKLGGVSVHCCNLLIGQESFGVHLGLAQRKCDVCPCAKLE